MLGVTLLKLEFFGGVEVARIQALAGAGHEIVEQRQVAGEMPRLQQRGLDGDVGGGQGEAFLERADAVADLDPDVPEQADQGLKPALGLGRWVGRQQQQHIDVRIGVQLAAAVTANRHQGGAIADAELLPKGNQNPIHQLAMGMQQLARSAAGIEGGKQGAPAGHQLMPVAGGERGLGDGRHGASAQTGSAGASTATAAGIGGIAGETVRTSKPCSVTSTVCSHWADRL